MTVQQVGPKSWMRKWGRYGHYHLDFVQPDEATLTCASIDPNKPGNIRTITIPVGDLIALLSAAGWEIKLPKQPSSQERIAMEFEVLDTPDGAVCAHCFKAIADPAAVFVMVNSRPNVIEAAIWLCWGCTMEMPERVAEARADLANRLELLEARPPSA